MVEKKPYETKEDLIRKAMNAKERREIMEQLRNPVICGDTEDCVV